MADGEGEVYYYVFEFKVSVNKWELPGSLEDVVVHFIYKNIKRRAIKALFCSSIECWLFSFLTNLWLEHIQGMV
jgi:hypothetical protein